MLKEPLQLKALLQLSDLDRMQGWVGNSFSRDAALPLDEQCSNLQNIRCGYAKSYVLRLVSTISIWNSLGFPTHFAQLCFYLCFSTLLARLPGCVFKGAKGTTHFLREESRVYC